MTFPDIRHYNNTGPFVIRDETYKSRGIELEARLCLAMCSVLGTNGEGQQIRVEKTLGDVLGFTRMDAKLGDSSVGTRPMGAWFAACPVRGIGGGAVLPIRTEAYEPDDRFLETFPVDYRGRPLRDGETGIVIAATEEDGPAQNLLFPTNGDLVAVNRTPASFDDGTFVFDVPDSFFARLQTAWHIMRPSPGGFLAHASPDKGLLAWQLGLNGQGQKCYGLAVDNKNTTDPFAITGIKKMWADFGSQAGGPLFVGEEKEEIHLLGSTDEGEVISAGHLTTNALFKMPISAQKKYRRLRFFDSPLDFEEEIYTLPGPLPFHSRVHLRWDPEVFHPFPTGAKLGKWRWLNESATGGSHPPEEPPDPPPIPPIPPPHDVPPPPIPPPHDVPPPPIPPPHDVPPPPIPPNRPPRVPDFPEYPTPPFDIPPPHTPGDPDDPTPLPPGVPVTPPPRRPVPPPGIPETPYVPRRPRVPFVPRRPTKITPSGRPRIGWEEYQQSPFSHAFPRILLKAGDNRIGAPNLRDYTDPHTKKEIWEWVETAPIVGQEEAYGGYATSTPVYTKRMLSGSSPFACGTGPGGKVLFQPELNIGDLRTFCNTGTDPLGYTNGTVSELNMVVAPLTFLNYGYPDLDTGSLKKGWRSRLTLGSQLHWSLKEYDGTETTLLRYPDDTTDPFEFVSPVQTDEDLIFKSGTSFRATHSHDNTADRDYEFQDKSGVIAHVDDITAVTYWNRIGSDLRPINPGDTISTTHSDSAPQVRGLTDTDTGASFKDDIFYGWTGGIEAFKADASQNFQVTGDIIFKSGTAFTQSFRHNFTGNHTLDFPDVSGTAVLIETNLLARSGTSIFPTTVGDSIQISDDGSDPKLTGTFSTQTGLGILANEIYFWADGQFVGLIDDLGNYDFTAGGVNAGELKVGGALKFKDSTAFVAEFAHAHSADRVHTLQNSSGTLAHTSDIVNQGWTRSGTNLAPTNAGDTIGITQSGSVATVRGATNTNTGVSVNSTDVLIWSDGVNSALFSSTITQLPGNIRFLSGTSFRGILDHANTAHRTYTFQNKSYTVAEKLDKTVFIPVLGSSDIHNGARAYFKGFFPADFASIVSMDLILVNLAADDTFNLDLSSEYGSSGQQFDTHTSTLNTDVNLTGGEYELVSVSARFGSAVAGDFFKFSVANNHVTKHTEIYGIKLVYVTTG